MALITKKKLYKRIIKNPIAYARFKNNCKVIDDLLISNIQIFLQVYTFLGYLLIGFILKIKWN